MSAVLLFALLPIVCQSQPASWRNGPVEFQPGVWIDWHQREVLVQTRVALRSGPLEFLACWPGKEHESILCFEAAPEAVYMALGLIGLSPGHPVSWDDAGSLVPPTGDLVNISLEWVLDGHKYTGGAFDWLREREYGRAPIPRPWIFAGSLRGDEGHLACGDSGVGVALVDFPDSFLCHTRRHPSSNHTLWAEAYTARIPPTGTIVRMKLRPAQPRRHEVVLDGRGASWLDGRYCSRDDLADLIGIAVCLNGTYVQTIRVEGGLRADQADLERALQHADISHAHWAWSPRRRE